MNRHPRGVRFLLALYPRWWRERYEDEFRVLLDQHGLSASCVLDVGRAALVARVRGDRTAPIDQRCRGAVASAFWGAAALAPTGMLLLWAIDPQHGGSIASAARARPLVWAPLIPAYLGLGGIGLLGVCAAATIGKQAMSIAWKTRDPDFVRPITMILTAALIVLVVQTLVYVSSVGLTDAQRHGPASVPLTRELAVAAWAAGGLIALVVGTSGATRLARRIPVAETVDLFILAAGFVICEGATLVGFGGFGIAMLLEGSITVSALGLLVWLGLLGLGGIPVAVSAVALWRCAEARSLPAST
jgi:hypothetical protein